MGPNSIMIGVLTGRGNLNTQRNIRDVCPQRKEGSHLQAKERLRRSPPALTLILGICLWNYKK